MEGGKKKDARGVEIPLTPGLRSPAADRPRRVLGQTSPTTTRPLRHPAGAYRDGRGGGAGHFTAPGPAGQGRIDVLVHPAMRGLLHWKVPPARPGRSIQPHSHSRAAGGRGRTILTTVTWRLGSTRRSARPS
jgi:hypothetical protein